MNSKIMRALAAPAVVALLAGLLAFLAVLAYSRSQPTVFTARTTVIVVPVTRNGGVDASYPTISSANLAAAAEYSHTPAVLDAVRAQVPGAPSVDEISKNITIDPIPASTVLRFNVSAGDEKIASGMATALAQQMEKADLFGSVARFRAVDPTAPVVTQVSPDTKLGTGLALVVGVMAGLATAAAWLMFLPRFIFRSQLRRAVDDPSIAVIDATTPARARRGFAMLDRVGGAELVAVGPNPRAVVHATAEGLDEGLVVPEGDARRVDAPVVLLVPRGKISRDELSSAVGILERSGRRLLGVALV